MAKPEQMQSSPSHAIISPYVTAMKEAYMANEVQPKQMQNTASLDKFGPKVSTMLNLQQQEAHPKQKQESNSRVTVSPYVTAMKEAVKY